MTKFASYFFYSKKGDTMKKIIAIVLGIMIILSINKKDLEEQKEEMRGVFISYIELQEKLKNQEENQIHKNIVEMLENCQRLKLNTVILQVRASSDAIYPSKIFPKSSYLKEETDILKIFIEESHKREIKLIAWINPYRISTTNDISKISKDSPAYSYRNTDTIWIGNGIFWNPSKEIVEEMIIKGVKEILEYPIDGLLIDDYFYPDKEIDRKDYEEYKKKTNISIEEYHFEKINQLLKKIHKECQKKNVIFGVSPDGNIENNYEKHFADVKKWMSSKEYIDFIMPQIYYGFYNSTKAYCKVLEEWESYLKEEAIDFYTALAFYKVGREDNYAKEGRKEWLENDNIIMREILLSRNRKNYQGFSLFRYDYLFEENHYTNNSKLELENLKKVIK